MLQMARPSRGSDEHVKWRPRLQSGETLKVVSAISAFFLSLSPDFHGLVIE